jgi:hypothetical protein
MKELEKCADVCDIDPHKRILAHYPIFVPIFPSRVEIIARHHLLMQSAYKAALADQSR